MRLIPNMTVLEIVDCTEVESICEAADCIEGPLHYRVLRGIVPRLFQTLLKVIEKRKRF